jgi:hypothetical protein
VAGALDAVADLLGGDDARRYHQLLARILGR